MIEKYISALLYRYQCVIVPGFGAFLTEVQSASFHEGSQTFFPPKKSISFNAQLIHNDGLLANHIALEEGISYEKAVVQITAVVSEWKQGLADDQTIFLKPIGSIHLNERANLVFEPQLSTNYLTSSFGLSTVSAPSIGRMQAIIAETTTPIISLAPKRQRKYTFLKYAAVLVVATSIGGTIYKQEQEAYIAEQTLNVEKAVQDKVDLQIQQATFFIEKPLTPVVLTVKEAVILKPYHIVASAFKSEENAAKAVKELEKKGYESSFLEKNKYGFYPVLYGSYANLAEAQAAMRAIHKKHNKEAWLLVK